MSLGLPARAGSISPPPPPLRIGISYGDTLVWMDDVQLGYALDDAVRVGAKWVRADLSWQDISFDSPEKQRWELFDRVVNAAGVRGLSVLPVLAYTPPWARPIGCIVQSCAPSDAQKFAAFAQEAATRYAPNGVHTWEIWNEPNLGFWKPTPSPAAFTKLLTVTAGAIRTADPAAKIVMGGLASASTGVNRFSQLDFLAQVCQLGGNKVVDAIGYHPYTFPYLPGTRTKFGTAWEKIDQTAISIRSVLKKFGTPDLPVWVTEVGAPTNGPGTASDGSPHSITLKTTHVTEQRQAEIARAAVASANADTGVQALFWYADQDLGVDRKTSENFFGLRRKDGSVKPAFQAFTQAISAVKRPQQEPPSPSVTPSLSAAPSAPAAPSPSAAAVKSPR
jgi:hypothetical protein